MSGVRTRRASQRSPRETKNILAEFITQTQRSSREMLLIVYSTS
jgi:hypothetical protein